MARKVDEAEAARPQYPIESVDNALRILLVLGERRSIRLSEVSEYLGVASSTAHRLLAMLQYRGFVRQATGSRAYEPGPALTTIAFGVLRQVDVRERLHPILERLSATLGETVHLGRLDGSQVQYVDAVESPRAVRVGSRLGMSMPAHCTSTGKALLSMLDEPALKRLYPTERLTGMTPHSITKRTALLKHLADIRKEGFATSHEEAEDGVGSVSVPLGEYGGSRYAINVGAPLGRMSPQTESEIVDELHKAAEECSAYFM